MLAAGAFRGPPVARIVACASSSDGSSSGGAPRQPTPPPVAWPPPPNSGSSSEGGHREQPWQLAAYYTKKLERRTGEWLRTHESVPGFGCTRLSRKGITRGPLTLHCSAADALGNILSSPDTIAQAPGWTPDAQLRLAAEALAPQLQQDADLLLDQAGCDGTRAMM